MKGFFTDFFKSFSRKNRSMMYYYKYDNLLISKMLIFNTFIICAMIYAVYAGVYNFIYHFDDTYLTSFIIIMTIIGMFISTKKALGINNELVRIKNEDKRKVLNEIMHTGNISMQNERNRQGLELALMERISLVKYISDKLVIMGFIGTVIGFIMVFLNSQINLDDLDTVKKLIPVILKGMGIALLTTLAGSIGHMILDINYHMLSKATTELYIRFLLKEEK